MNKGGGANPNEVVVYSAGGGAHVAAEAIALLRNTGMSQETIKQHFAIVQHGRTNFALNLEAEARDITRVYTLPIAKQDLDTYANGMDGPGLGRLVRDGIFLEGDRFGHKMADALDVAQGLRSFQNLGPNKTFKPTTDGSDAGSHAFAVDEGTLMASWGRRLKPGDYLPNAIGKEHLIAEADGDFRQRVIYDEFDWRDARALMNGGGSAAQAATETAVGTAGKRRRRGRGAGPGPRSGARGGDGLRLRRRRQRGGGRGRGRAHRRRRSRQGP